MICCFVLISFWFLGGLSLGPFLAYISVSHVVLGVGRGTDPMGQQDLGARNSCLVSPAYRPVTRSLFESEICWPSFVPASVNSAAFSESLGPSRIQTLPGCGSPPVFAAFRGRVV